LHSHPKTFSKELLITHGSDRHDFNIINLLNFFVTDFLSLINELDFELYCWGKGESDLVYAANYSAFFKELYTTCWEMDPIK
jgi:hypothetical protein